ncbi:hypothetical protein YC2023_055762 [Brassica napus]
MRAKVYSSFKSYSILVICNFSFFIIWLSSFGSCFTVEEEAYEEAEEEETKDETAI